MSPQVDLTAIGVHEVWSATSGTNPPPFSSCGNSSSPGTAAKYTPFRSWGQHNWAKDAPGEVVAASVVLWTFLYFASRVLLPFSRTYGKWDRERQYKARGLVPSSVFLVCSVVGSVWALTCDSELKEMRVTGATSGSLLISAFATGYFIYDSCVVLYHFKEDGAAYLLHGLLCMVTYGVALRYEVYQFYAPCFLLFESTTLFVNCRWVLAELNLKESALYVLNGLVLLIAWFFVRIVWGYSSSYFFWIDTLDAHSKGEVAAPIVAWYMLANLSLNTLNTLWFSKILKGALKALKPSKRD